MVDTTWRVVPTPFDGSQSVNEWFTRFEGAEKVNSWTEAQLPYIFATMFTGRAFLVFEKIPEADRKLTARVKGYMQKEFGPVDKNTMGEWPPRMKKSTESYIQYEQFLRDAYATLEPELNKNAELTDVKRRHLLHGFLRGIGEQYRHLVVVAQKNSIEDARELVEKFGQEGLTDSIVPTAATTLKQRTDMNNDKSDTIDRRNERPLRKRKRGCYYCHRVGHLRVDCPLLKKHQQEIKGLQEN